MNKQYLIEEKERLLDELLVIEYDIELAHEDLIDLETELEQLENDFEEADDREEQEKYLCRKIAEADNDLEDLNAVYSEIEEKIYKIEKGEGIEKNS